MKLSNEWREKSIAGNAADITRRIREAELQNQAELMWNSFARENMIFPRKNPAETKISGNTTPITVPSNHN